ncbi:MAG: hypothetical protein M1828_003948 [Chrysothrix sp. TS-e1954]|nr:MAG: hypothetical protein M1828_003948 [Chrysothrix sp. TS-e1954]
MHASTLLAAATATLFTPFITASTIYSQTLNCDHTNFFSCFDFYTGADPTNGYVQYVNQSYATSAGLINTANNLVHIGVDSTHKYSPTGAGRPSVRLQSKTAYTHGLYILQLTHMPFGCGTWPSFWSYGPDWPSNGEIDIIEGVNLNTKNLMSAHTGPDCTIAGTAEFGTLVTNNCTSGAGTSGAGCGVQANLPSSYGAGFNTKGGGVFAMEWTSAAIKVWFWAKGDIPAAVLAASPDTSKFGQASANFAGSCDIDAHFADHNIIFDTTFCGDYAGNSYGSTTCPMASGVAGYQSCVDYVAANPSAFANAYWTIQSLKVFQLAAGTVSSTSKLSSSTPLASTARVSSVDAAQGATTTKAAGATKSSSLPVVSSTAKTTAK